MNMNSVSDSTTVKGVREVAGWRAFVPVLLIGTALIGMLHPNDPNLATAYTACVGGALVAGIYAIFIRNLTHYWSITWRLYLTYVAGSCLFGGLSAGNYGAGAALGAAIVAGVIVIPPSVALFFWDNIATQILSYLSAVLLVISIFKAFA
jgi:hypothetical protein